MGGEGTELEKITLLGGQFESLILFTSTVIATGITLTGPSIDVQRSSSQTIFIDITGAAATGVICTLRGGKTNFGFVTLRTLTGSGGSPGTYIWKAGANALTSGMAAETTGITRIDDLFLQIQNPTSVTGGGSVTVKSIALTSPDF